MTGSDSGDLPDANVWLALASTGHVHHAEAQSWVAARPELRLLKHET